MRPARPLPYMCRRMLRRTSPAGTITVNFDNNGKAGACFHVRSPNGSSAGGSTGPWSYTVEAGKSLFDTWTPGDDDSYALTVNGPNGFFRKFAGSLAAGAVDLTVVASYDASGIALRITNNTAANVPVDVTDTYTNEMRSKDPGARRHCRAALLAAAGPQVVQPDRDDQRRCRLRPPMCRARRKRRAQHQRPENGAGSAAAAYPWRRRWAGGTSRRRAEPSRAFARPGIQEVTVAAVIRSPAG